MNGPIGYIRHTMFRARFLEKPKLSLKTDKSIKILSRISKHVTDNFSQTINL